MKVVKCRWDYDVFELLDPSVFEGKVMKEAERSWAIDRAALMPNVPCRRAGHGFCVRSWLSFKSHCMFKMFHPLPLIRYLSGRNNQLAPV
jgi:hypothetical protein